MRPLIHSALALGVLAISTGCVSKRKYNELQAAYNDLRDEHVELTTTADGLRVENDNLDKYVAELEARNEELGSFYAELIQDFEPILKNGEATLVVYPDRMSLALTEDVSFGTGSASMTGGRQTVRKIAGLLEKHDNRRFIVEGHTDSRPINNAQYKNNWELGAARAVTVLQSLVAAGVPKDRLAAVSYADTAPMASGSNASAMRQNRRVQLTFQPTLDELPGHRDLVKAAERVVEAPGAQPVERERPVSKAPGA